MIETFLTSVIIWWAASAGGADVTKLLIDAQHQYDAVEFESVLPLVEEALLSPIATPAQQLDAYVLQGSCLAVLGRTVDAENAFRLLLRVRPAFALPGSTSPKILTVFQKVKLEEEALRSKLVRFERERILATLKLTGAPAPQAQGGLPIGFRYRLQDPEQAVAVVVVHYRRADDAAFSSVGLRIDPDESQDWVGEIPAHWSESEQGFMLKYFVATKSRSDDRLLSLGSAQVPQTIEVAAGLVQDNVPLYARWWVWTTGAGVVSVAAAAVAVSALGGGVYLATRPPASGLGVFDVRSP